MKRVFKLAMIAIFMGVVCLLLQSFDRNENESGKSPYKNKTGAVMKGYLQDIESIATKNTDFRRVLYTTKQSQLVLMALKPGEEIGAEVHKSDQFFVLKTVPVKRFSITLQRKSKPVLEW